jgi:hypothetical protein
MTCYFDDACKIARVILRLPGSQIHIILLSAVLFCASWIVLFSPYHEKRKLECTTYYLVLII